MLSDSQKKLLCTRKVQPDPSVNINSILDRFQRTGLLPLVDATKAKYEDFTQPMSFKDALILKRNADEAFEKLPAKIRDRFKNDVNQMISFINDPKNADEAIELGLIKKPVPSVDELQLAALNQINDSLAQSKT